jgi:radical SAM protein with 4Fe4S-binding SPASM domain
MLDEIDRMSRCLSSVSHINLTGGEPFLREDISDIIEIFYRNSGIKSFGITTNGYSPVLITNSIRKLIARLRSITVHISVSLDHYGQRHDVLRNHKGLFKNAIQTIQFLKEIRSNQVAVGVNLLLSKDNECEIEQIYEYIRDEVKPDTLDPICIRGELKENKIKNVSADSYERLITLWKEDIKNHKFRGYYNYSFGSLLTVREIITKNRILEMLRNNGPYRKCYAGILGGVIREDGEIFPCELLEESFGNIKEYDYDLKKIWNSEKARLVKMKIKRDKCVCTHECFQNLNALFNISNSPLFLREWAKMNI